MTTQVPKHHPLVEEFDRSFQPAHVYRPTPKQAEVFSLIAEAPEGSLTLIGYGGAAGGGKSNLLANLAIEIGRQCPGSRTLVGRQDMVDLETTTEAEFDGAMPPQFQVKRYNSSPVYRDFRANETDAWSRVYFRGVKDWQSMLSDSFGWVLLDEAHQITLQAALGLMSRLRHQPEKKWGMVCAFNPFPGWCVEWFYRNNVPSEVREAAQRLGLDLRIHFVQARVDDNPHVPAVYKAILAANPDPYMRAILLDGNPDAALDSVLYFDRASLEAGKALCSEPVETRLTRIEPEAPADGHVLIWEKPLTGERYYIGADTADGKGEPLSISTSPGREFGGPDRNAAAIYRARDNVQVAAIYGRQQEHQFARVLNDYGRWYNNALLGVERNRRSVLVALRELDYPNLYYTEKVTDMHLVGVVNPVRTLEWGWLTDTKTRPTLLSDFREAWTMRALRPRDAALYEEGFNFLAGEKPEAAEGFHDDRIFAHAIAWQVRKALGMGTAPQGPRLLSTSVSFGGAR